MFIQSMHNINKLLAPSGIMQAYPACMQCCVYMYASAYITLGYHSAVFSTSRPRVQKRRGHAHTDFPSEKIRISGLRQQ